jgi:hypothetical protein
MTRPENESQRPGQVLVSYKKKDKWEVVENECGRLKIDGGLKLAKGV